MIIHIWTVLCTNTIIDRDSNNLSLIDVLEQWNIPSDVEFPLNIGNPFVLVSMWSKSDADESIKGRVRIIVENPSSKTKEFPEFEIDLTKYRRYRTRNGFQGMQITEAGIYLFKVELLEDGAGGASRIVAEIPLEIIHVDH